MMMMSEFWYGDIGKLSSFCLKMDVDDFYGEFLQRREDTSSRSVRVVME